MDAEQTLSEPFLAQPVRRRTLRLVGRVRLPIAGPYRPWARLYQLPDGRLWWTVRLWEEDRAVRHVYPTWVIRGFARRNLLPGLEAEIDTLVARALEATRASG